MEVACGQCIGCRIDRVGMWAVRNVHESCLPSNHFGSCFITLTYRDPSECTPDQLNKGHYIPSDYSLNKSHFQKFIKRLRKHFSDRKIRYFHCGEYGELGRPHYHALLFNVDFADSIVYKQEQGVTTYESETLANLWPYGFSTVGELNWDTASYTSGYILKKITGRKAEDHYMRCDEYGVAYWLQPEYVTMSLKPGIGAEYYEQYKDDIFPSDKVWVPGKGLFPKVPKYYQTLLERSDPETLELVRKDREQFMKLHGHDFTPERLEARHKCALHRQKEQSRQLD